MVHPGEDEGASASMGEVVARPARLDDLAAVASWVTNQEELTRWTGPRYTYPLDLDTLPEQFDWESSESWALDLAGGLVAFGQCIARGSARQHLQRIITSPMHRRMGLGARLVGLLLERSRLAGADTVTLNVRPGNVEALGLYMRLGFSEATRPSSDRPLPSTFLAYDLRRS